MRLFKERRALNPCPNPREVGQETWFPANLDGKAGSQLSNILLLAARTRKSWMMPWSASNPLRHPAREVTGSFQAHLNPSRSGLRMRAHHTQPKDRSEISEMNSFEHRGFPGASRPLHQTRELPERDSHQPVTQWPVPQSTSAFRVDDEIRLLLTGIREQRGAPRTRVTLAIQPGLSLAVDPALFRHLVSSIVLMSMLQPLTTAVLIGARKGHRGVKVVVCHDGAEGPPVDYFSDHVPPEWRLRYDFDQGAGATFTLTMP